MKIFVSRWACSEGIREFDATVGDDGYVAIGHSYLKFGRDCYNSLGSAQADARKRVDKKIASLKRQIAKLEKMTF